MLTFNCNLVTAEGVPVKCTYVGSLDISGMPGPVSTLTGDYELALDGATGAAYYYGDYLDVNYEKAYKIFSELAKPEMERKHELAYRMGKENLAKMYYYGQYVEQSYQKAYDIFKELVEKYNDKSAKEYLEKIENNVL